MTTRERFRAIMNFESFDRLPILEWAPWWKLTLERWYSGGLPTNIKDRYDICRHFGLDIYRSYGFSPRTKDCPQPPGHGMGIIASEEAYEKILPHLYPAAVVDRDERLHVWAEEQERGESVIRATFDGFFWFPRTLLGIERHLYAFYDQPGLLRRIGEDLAGWMLDGGFLVSCDHQTPPGVSYAQYRDYLDLFREYATRAGRMSQGECL